jgi:hypothetical protein
MSAARLPVGSGITRCEHGSMSAARLPVGSGITRCEHGSRSAAYWTARSGTTRCVRSASFISISHTRMIDCVIRVKLVVQLQLRPVPVQGIFNHIIFVKNCIQICHNKAGHVRKYFCRARVSNIYCECLTVA